VSCDWDELTRLWLAVRVHRLWREAGGDVARACAEFDRLVVEFGRWYVARAMSDAGLSDVADEPVRPGHIIGVETS
jgi:hypothetical protein